MTEFERIKAMDVIELAIYINRLQNKAIEDYDNGFFPKGVFDTISMLESEVKDTCSEKTKSAADYVVESKSVRSRTEPVK